MRVSVPLSSAVEPLSQVAMVVEMERAGLDVVWVAETWGYEGFHGVAFIEPVARLHESMDICRMVWRRGPVRYEGSAYRLPLEICAGGLCAVGEGAEVDGLRDLARTELALYIGGMGSKGANYYDELFCRLGWEGAAGTTLAAVESDRGREMSERREGLRSGRDVAGLVGDAVMSSLADLVERLRDAAPQDQAAAVAVELPADGARAPSARALPARAVVDLVAALVAAIVPVVLSRIDPDELLDRVDVQRVVDRVDVEKLVGRIDLDDLAGRLDVDALLARVDVDALVRRVDLTAATREAMEAVDIGEVIRDSTATIGSDVVEGLRSQAMRADELVARALDLVLGRRGPRRTALDPPRGAR